jgi:hypothetical protein
LLEICNKVNPFESFVKLEPRMNQLETSSFILGSKDIQSLGNLGGHANTTYPPPLETILCTGELVAFL